MKPQPVFRANQPSPRLVAYSKVNDHEGQKFRPPGSSREEVSKAREISEIHLVPAGSLVKHRDGCARSREHNLVEMNQRGIEQAENRVRIKRRVSTR